MKSILKTSLGFGIFLTLTLTLTLSVTPQGSQADEKEQKLIRVGSSAVVSSAGIYLADEFGYFKDLGLNVVITDFKNSGAPLTVPLAAGELEIGAGNFSAGLFNAISQGVGIRLVADKGHLEKGHDYLALLVRKDHVESGRFKTLKDLKDMNLGLTALNGVSQEILADRFLKSVGLTTKDVRFLKMSYSEMNAAFASKSLDATIQLEPYVSMAIKKGLAVKFGNASEIYPKQASAGIFYGPSMTKERRDEGVRFMAAYLMGVRDYRDAVSGGKNREKVLAALQKRMNIDPEVLSTMIPVGLHPDGMLDKKSLEADLNWYQKMGYLKEVPKVSSLLDDGIAKDAVRLIKSRHK